MDALSIPSIMNEFSELFPTQASFAVSDESCFLYYQPSKYVDLHIKPGDYIKEGSCTYKALHTRHKIAETIGPQVFGVPYYGMSVPIFEHERPAGCITAILPAKPSVYPFLTVRTTDRWVPVPYGKINYLESQHRKTKVKADTLVGMHKCNLSELEFILPLNEFIRVHRSYIVNPKFIQEIQPDSHSTFLLIMKDQSKIPVSQSYSSYFRKAMNF